jgi:outer membrane lipoprotein SlyB
LKAGEMRQNRPDFYSKEIFMRRALRLSSASASVFVLAALTACGTVPMNSPYPPSYPASYPSGYPAKTPAPAPYPGQYPAPQYPAQYPNQYPNQTRPAAQTPPANAVEYGRVTNIEAVQTSQKAQGSGLGAILGGVAGAVVGRQIGGGTGRDIATIAGAVGGALAGNEIEKSGNAKVVQIYRATVRLDSGSARAYDLPAVDDLRIGDRVRIQNGQLSRY